MSATADSESQIGKLATEVWAIVFLIVLVDVALLKPYKSHYEKRIDGDLEWNEKFRLLVLFTYHKRRSTCASDAVDCADRCVAPSAS